MKFAAFYEKIFIDNIKEINQELRKNPTNLDTLEGLFASLQAMLHIFGIELKTPLLTGEIKDIYNEYLSLKKEKRFEESDKLRNILIEKNIL